MSRQELQKQVLHDTAAYRTGKQLRILLIEDHDPDAVLIREALRLGDGLGPFHLQRVATLKDGFSLLETTKFDLALLDLSLPDARGIETFQSLNAKFPEIPVVVLSGNLDNQVALEVVARGAQDFFSKEEIRPVALSKTVRYAVSRSYIAILEKAALRERQVELERLSELKSQFLAHMSHEIRTPLNAVIGMASLLSQHELPEEQMKYVDTIRSSGDALLQILNDILDLSKIQSGKFSLEETEFSVRHLVEEVADLFSAQACAKDLFLLENVDTKIPSVVKGDSARLRQVLINLVSNAVKYSLTGGVTLDCKISPESPLTLRFEVKDSGIGIKAEDQAQLFQAFNQLNNSSTKKFGGTGLGLVICKKIVELMGGTIGLESAPGEGSLFFFELPAKVVESQGFRPRPALEKKKALTLVPNETQSKFLTYQMRARGLSVSQLFSKQGLAESLKAPEIKIDLIVLTAESETEWDELREYLSASPIPHSVPVLWVVPNRLASYKHGGDAVLPVPYVQSRLYEMIASLTSTVPESATPVRHQKPLPAFSVPSEPVLVADDDPINRRLMQRMLDRLTLRSEAVENGREAIEAARKNRYSVILMDCSMPEVDGWTAAQAIRKLGRDCPIIALTAHAFKEDRDRSLQSGMNYHLTKPVTIESLAGLLLEVFPAGKKPEET